MSSKLFEQACRDGNKIVIEFLISNQGCKWWLDGFCGACAGGKLLIAQQMLDKLMENCTLAQQIIKYLSTGFTWGFENYQFDTTCCWVWKLAFKFMTGEEWDTTNKYTIPEQFFSDFVRSIDLFDENCFHLLHNFKWITIPLEMNQLNIIYMFYEVLKCHDKKKIGDFLGNMLFRGFEANSITAVRFAIRETCQLARFQCSETPFHELTSYLKVLRPKKSFHTAKMAWILCCNIKFAGGVIFNHFGLNGQCFLLNVRVVRFYACLKSSIKTKMIITKKTNKQQILHLLKYFFPKHFIKVIINPFLPLNIRD